MDLWAADAPWQAAASRVTVFKLYGEWVDQAGPAALRAAVEGIRARGMVLGVEAGPLDPADGCGTDVEGFAGSGSGRRLAQKIRDAGGVLQVIALDEPWYFGHVYDGPNACRWPVGRIARGVARFVAQVREEFPWVAVGDIEPTPLPVQTDHLAEWMGAYREAVGEPMAFLHLDLDWSRSNWSQMALQVEAAGDRLNVPVGIIYTGGGAPSDEQWLGLAGQRALDHEERDGGQPAHVVFQSWNDKPDRVLPENDQGTFTSLIGRYFDDRDSLGIQDATGNLALRRPASATASLAGSGPRKAVDGDPETSWNAGVGPEAYIQIDLGRRVRIGSVRLYVGQSPPGRTVHRLLGSASPGSPPLLLAELTGRTADYDVLQVMGREAWPGIRYLRIVTIESPSWVAWREIEVVAR
jgi:hypothetical protein